MHSIEAMNRDIHRQIEQLVSLDLQSVEENIEDCIFTGSGDSFVASLIGSYASNYRAKCCHPMDIVMNPKIVLNRKVFLVSVSGSTRATLLAAKMAKRYAQRTVSITAKPESPLGRTSDELIKVQYKSTNVVTAGTIGFTACVMNCISLMIKVKVNNLQKTFNESAECAESLIKCEVEEPSKHVFLGNGLAFPAALYGSLKMNEVFGMATFAYNLDDYCHSPIFSIKTNDMIIIMANNEGDVRVSKVIRNHLSKHNVPVFSITSTRQNMVKNILKFIFFSQLYPAKLAMKNGLEDCYFLKNSDLLGLSSSLIYTKTANSLQ